MRITVTIDFDGDALPRISVQNRRAASPPTEARPTVQPVAESHSASPRTPAELVSAQGPEQREYDSVTRLAPICTALRRMPTPFTRAALAAELGCDRASATAHLNRCQKRGWVESPAHGLWRTTQQFATDNQ